MLNSLIKNSTCTHELGKYHSQRAAVYFHMKRWSSKLLYDLELMGNLILRQNQTQRNISVKIQQEHRHQQETTYMIYGPSHMMVYSYSSTMVKRYSGIRISMLQYHSRIAVQRYSGILIQRYSIAFYHYERFVYHYTTISLYHYTSIPLHHRTNMPLYQYTTMVNSLTAVLIVSNAFNFLQSNFLWKIDFVAKSDSPSYDDLILFHHQ